MVSFPLASLITTYPNRSNEAQILLFKLLTTVSYVCVNRDINPDVEIEVWNYNITTTENFDHFQGRIKYVLGVTKPLPFPCF